MKHDDFLTYIFQFSSVAPATQETYKKWITKCCRFTGQQHVLDLSPSQISDFRLFLVSELDFSPQSSMIVYAALKYLYGTLLQDEVPQDIQISRDRAATFLRELGDPPKQQMRVPEIISHAQVEKFLQSLPNSTAGNVLRAVYTTGCKVDTILSNGRVQITYSKHYLQQLCRKTARKASIPPGFGIRGLRATGLVHRILQRQDDTKLKTIYAESQLSSQQFAKYLKLARSMEFSQ